MIGWAIVAVVVVFLFITMDAIRSVMTKRAPMVKNEAVSRESERVKKLEDEVEEKMNEIRRHQSERIRPAPAPASAPAPGERDPMNDTRCMAAVKEKADEIERLGREKGISKS